MPVLVIALSGCALPWDHDHDDRLDRISLTAGDAQQRNIHVHAVDPVPPQHPLPAATYDGRRALAAMELYYGRVGIALQDETGGPAGDDAGL